MTGIPSLPGESTTDYARRTAPLHAVAQSLDPDMTDPGQLERLAALVDTEPREESA